MLTYATIFGAIVGLTLFTSPAAVMAMPSGDNAAPLEARKWRSNIDVTELCHHQWGNDWKATNIGNGCNDWRCKHGEQEGAANMNSYCSWKFPNDSIYAACGGGTVWDWQCHDRT